MPSYENMEKLETYINGSDTDGFWNDESLREWYLKFLHTYGVCAKDKTVIKESIEIQNKSIFDVLTVSDQAFVVLLYVNNHEGWCEKRQKATGPADPIHKKCLTRWTRPSKNRGCELYGNGWDQEGMNFFHKAEAFFKLLHEDGERDGQLRRDAASWWAMHVRGGEDGVPPLEGGINVSLARLCYTISGKYRKKGTDVASAAADGEETVDTGFSGITFVGV